jgi:hypothetical protein
MGTERFRCVVLSYHSWETAPDVLLDDIAALRGAGWSAIGVDELHDNVARRAARAGRCVLVTSDDGHPEDEQWIAALRSASCPGVTFVNVGRLGADRAAFYGSLGPDALVAVEDHGRWHRRCFIGSRVLDLVGPDTRLGGLDHLALPVGYPLCATAGELSTPAFLPDPRIAVAVGEATAEAGDGGATTGNVGATVIEVLLGRGLARRRLGQLHLAGRFESGDEYVRRVGTYIEDGRRAFESIVGRPPRYYAYTWWQGSRAADAVLAAHGYRGSFWGRDRAQRADGRPFGMPRVMVEPRTPRPLRLDGVRPRGFLAERTSAPVKRLIKTALGVR